MFEKYSSGISTALLIVAVAFWGGTFVFVKESVDVFDVYFFLFWRFLLAGIALAPLALLRSKNFTFEMLKKSVGVGLVVTLSYIFQTVGLRYTTATNSAFITGLCVVFVPMIVAGLDRKAPAAQKLISLVLGLAGLALMTVRLPMRFNAGDVWTLLCALAFAVQVVLIARWAPRTHAAAFTVVQLFIVSLACGVIGAATKRTILVPEGAAVWRAILYCAVFGSAFTFTIQARFQRFVSEVKAVMIYSLEPVFAAVIAFFYLGEKMSLQAMLGGALILGGMMAADFKFVRIWKNFRRQPPRPNAKADV